MANKKFSPTITNCFLCSDIIQYSDYSKPRLCEKCMKDKILTVHKLINGECADRMRCLNVKSPECDRAIRVWYGGDELKCYDFKLGASRGIKGFFNRIFQWVRLQR